jgi:ParB family chromosome partitioning protein
VPVVVKEYTPQQIAEIAIIENLQREDLNPIESARAIKELMTTYNMTQERVADKIGKSRPAVANTLRLLTLPTAITDLILSGKLSAGHARALLAVEDEKLQKELALRAIEKKLSVRDLEQLIKKIAKGEKTKAIEEKSVELKNFVADLNKVFATKVNVLGNDKKGRIIINYYSADDLQRIYDIINKD